MTPLWIFILSLKIVALALSVDSSKPSFLSVKSGEKVILHCPFSNVHRAESVVWFKQIFGEMPQKVGEKLPYEGIKMYPMFITSGFKMEKTDTSISLIIPHVKKAHGGFYYCGNCYLDNVTLSSGTLLDVTGDEDIKVSVSQSSVSDSVPAGASVTLQCSVLSESRAAELQVLWFRAAPPQSHPQIIYTHHNSSHQCESGSSTHTCVYNFSKNSLSHNDTGTYYCAVAVCGKIIFGNGTRVQLESIREAGPEVIYLTVLGVVFAAVIFAQAVIICKIRNGEQSRVRTKHDSVIVKTPNQGCDAEGLNYAALHFNKRNTKRVKQEKPENCVYTEVAFGN